MKKIYALVAVFMLSAAGFSEAAVGTASPASLPAVQGISSTATVVYRVSDVAHDNCAYRSGRGQFLVSGAVIEENPLALTVPIPPGVTSGSATEALRISAGVVEKALRQRSRSIQYVRVFDPVTCDDLPVTTRITISITGEAAAEFSINRVELYFENRRPEITIERNMQKLKAFADIRFSGSGLLEGYWEVDGRLISREFRHLTYGRSVTLQTPDIPGLPTFDEGSHIVRFVITKPATEIATPFIVYFVTPKESKVQQIPLLLLGPLDGATAHPGAKFSWEKPGGATLFLISFYEQTDGIPVFSAFTREPFYTLPVPVVGPVLPPGRYFWKVTGFNDENSQISESAARPFILK